MTKNLVSTLGIEPESHHTIILSLQTRTVDLKIVEVHIRRFIVDLKIVEVLKL